MEESAHTSTQDWATLPEPLSLPQFLRTQHPTGTAKAVAAAVKKAAPWLSLSHRTVQKWLDGTSGPSVWHLFGLSAAYGADAVIAAFPRRLGWLDAAAIAAKHAELDRKIAELHKLKGSL